MQTGRYLPVGLPEVPSRSAPLGGARARHLRLMARHLRSGRLESPCSMDCLAPTGRTRTVAACRSKTSTAHPVGGPSWRAAYGRQAKLAGCGQTRCGHDVDGVCKRKLQNSRAAAQANLRCVPP
eukprot:scaffold90577_cov59-Phaeocystis_antarctica.AAC.1